MEAITCLGVVHLFGGIHQFEGHSPVWRQFTCLKVVICEVVVDLFVKTFTCLKTINNNNNI